MKKNFVGEFRKYDKINCTIFDLIGGDLEPKQTMALGFLFSKSRSALNAFLKLIGVKVTFDKCIVDCEPRRNEEGNNDRIDILLRLYQDEHPVKAIIIEAKSVKAKTSEIVANNQVQKYLNGFSQMKGFSNIETVTLTQDVKTLVEGSTSITWLELVNELSNVQGKEPIIKDFINYILNIKGNMKHYEEEIVSIPAGNSYEAVVSSGIYECPVDYNTPKKALFMTFREKDGGAMRTLYKLLDVLELDLDDEASIEKVDKQLNLKDRLDRYKSIGTPSKGVKKVYVLDVDNAITLPIPVTPMENNTSKIYYKLGDFIGKCNTNKGDNKDDYRIVSPFKIDGHTLSVPRSKRNCILKKEDGTLVKDFSCNEGSIELNKEYVYELFVQGDKRSIRLNKIRISYEAGSWKMFYDYKK